MNNLEQFLAESEKEVILAAAQPGLSKKDQLYFARLRDMTLEWTKLIRNVWRTDDLNHAVMIIAKLAGATAALASDKNEGFNAIKTLIQKSLDEARDIITDFANRDPLPDIEDLLKDPSKIDPALIDSIDGQYCGDPACVACQLRKVLVEKLRAAKAVGKAN